MKCFYCNLELTLCSEQDISRWINYSFKYNRFKDINIHKSYLYKCIKCPIYHSTKIFIYNDQCIDYYIIKENIYLISFNNKTVFHIDNILKINLPVTIISTLPSLEDNINKFINRCVKICNLT